MTTTNANANPNFSSEENDARAEIGELGAEKYEEEKAAVDEYAAWMEAHGLDTEFAASPAPVVAAAATFGPEDEADIPF
jgi:hypothetical protein